VCEVEIDPQTGKVDVQRYSVIDDVGKVINLLTLKGQIQGGTRGLNQARWRCLRRPRDRTAVSGSFMDYAVPRADSLCSIDIHSNPCPTPTNPLGVKGAGEAGTVGALASVMNAVVNALSPLGISHLDMPCTSERIWRAIRGVHRP
jgi:carbon-monoxide dehydrogenase large subunit